jgi:hypothetical protein
MGDDVRITVIATGFDRPAGNRAISKTAYTGKEENRNATTSPVAESVEIQMEKKNINEFQPVVIDTRNIDLPTFLRKYIEDKPEEH